MSRFTLTFDTDNSVFRDDDDGLVMESICDILYATAGRVEGFVAFKGKHEFLIREVNGNQIGSAFIEED